MPANMYMFAGFFVLWNRLIFLEVYQQHNVTKKSRQFDGTFFVTRN